MTDRCEAAIMTVTPAGDVAGATRCVLKPHDDGNHLRSCRCCSFTDAEIAEAAARLRMDRAA
jgi:hypothetical protein